jgi:hypothetical protein
MRFSNGISATLIVAICAFLSGCSERSSTDRTAFEPVYTTPVNSRFQALDDAQFKPPTFTEVELSAGVPAAAIWGATGRDNEGNIYFGLSNHTNIHDTAYLVQYNPTTGTSNVQSDTVSQLKKAKLYVEDMSQNKLHSKFFMAQDGYLYFSSFDEKGESSTENPTYGGNLWRKLPQSTNWEHLLATDEALIAVNLSGRFIYALGYWDHVLYQYDTITQRSTRIAIGSIAGHISRNFIVNSRGYAFVPRVETLPNGQVSAVLVELSPAMAIADLHPLDDYISEDGHGNHGIVGYTMMKNGDAYFTVASGGLYHITESLTGGHEVNYLGKFEPQHRNSYIASLFSPDGESLLVGLGRNKNTEGYFWYIRELSTQLAVNYPIETIPNKGYLLYGSITTDDKGGMYIVGRDGRKQNAPRPLVLKASYGQSVIASSN